MKRIKVIIKYILGVILSFSIFFITLLGIAKYTVLNKNYIYKTMDKLNYYDSSYKTINENLILANMSSGFDDDILVNIFTIDDVKRDIKSTIESIYSNKKININTDNIRSKINTNIDKYIKDNKIKVNNNKALEEHIDELIKVYTNEITYYSVFNDYINLFNKLSKVISIVFIILIISIIILLVLMIILKDNMISSSFMGAGLFMIFIYYHTIINIDFNTITIISTNFSYLIRNISNHLLDIYRLFMYLYIIIGLIIGIIKKNKE